MATITIKRGNDTMQIPSGDMNYWQGQGWSSSGDSTIDPTTTGKKILTSRRDVIANFHKYMGRNPSSQEDWDTIDYLTTKPPAEVESKLKGSAPKEKGETEGTDETEGTEEETEIDPFKEAAKYGYTKEDFANDPGFYDYWKNKSADELKNGLANRGDWNSTDSKKKTEEDSTRDTATEDWIQELIDSGQINENQGSILEEILAGDYTSTTAPTDEEIEQIISDAELNATTDLSPYYKKTTQEELEDLKTSYADIRGESLRYQQQESKDYAGLLKSTKANLRARNMTFSGESRQTLGAESALRDNLGIEGEVPMERRYNWEDKSADWQQRSRDVGTAAERRLGSGKLHEERDYLQGEGLADPYGMGKGNTYGTEYDRSRLAPIFRPHKKEHREYVKYGDLPLERKKAIEESKWSRVEKYKIDTPRLSKYGY